MSRKAATVEQKAAAFDAPVKVMQGRHDYVQMVRRPVKTANPRTMRFVDLPVFEWRLRAEGSCDIESELLKLIKTER